MLAVAITGGIACGKSEVVRRLMQRLPSGRARAFNCDEEVARLLARPEVGERVASFAPEGLFDGPEGFDKGALRKEAFENSRFRGKLEGLLHPLVLEEAERFARESSGDAALALFEVPLLYEVEFPLTRAIDLVVAASESSQLERLRAERGIAEAEARRMLGAQWPVSRKVERAQVVVWNDGDIASLHAQVDHLADRCEPLFESFPNAFPNAFPNVQRAQNAE